MNVVVVGAGIVGAVIARKLSMYDLNLIILEKQPEAGWGITKANSGIVHAGYDDPPGTLRASLCSRGNMMYEEMCKQLKVDFKRIGSLVVAFTSDEVKVLHELMRRGELNNVKGLKLLDREEVLSLEPRLNGNVIAALHAETAGITEPWMVAIACVENAVQNGAKFLSNTKVIGFEIVKGRIRYVLTDGDKISADVVINATGMESDLLAKLAGVYHPPLHPRRGQYILIDKNAGNIVNSVIFPTPTKDSKGILVLPTVDGGTLIGPNAEDLGDRERESVSTTLEGLREVLEKASHLVPHLPVNRVIKTFAGLRPETPNKDFYITAETSPWGFVNVGGMRSPGLTAAPAIAEYVVEYLIPEKLHISLTRKKDFNPERQKIPHPADSTPEKWHEMIARDKRWGRIVCACNEVTEMEIREAIRRGARTLDAIKFRTRAMFGKCQGGFCTHRIMKILAEETGQALEDVLKAEAGSWILNGKVRP